MSRGARTIALFLILMFLAGRGVEPMDLSFGDITDVLHFTREVVTSGLETLEWTRKGSPEDHENDFPFIKKMERRLMDQIASAARKIDAYQGRMEIKSNENLDTILRNLPLGARLDRSFNDLTSRISRVNDMFEDFLAYNMSGKYERYTMEDFAKNCVSSGADALPDILQKIHRLVIPGQYLNLDNSILVLLAQNIKAAMGQLCNMTQSPQQLLYNLYNTITLTEIKGYTMIQFSYTLLRLYKNGTFSEEIKSMKNKYIERIGETLRAVKNAMIHAPRKLWKCDPIIHKEDSTYTKLKQLIQGYIVNEVDLSPTGSCNQNCAYYRYAEVQGCFKNQYCAQQPRCNGKVLNCQYVDSDMWICPSENKSNRRYDYIEYENGRVFGGKKSCSGGLTKVDSWWRWLFYHCSYCMCFCDDKSGASHRHFSLKSVVSDVENNRVITGIKLTKMNKIIHLAIQQGELIQRANISSSTVHWKDVDNFTIKDRDVKNGRDYHTLEWGATALDLDELSVKEGHVVTGVRFRLLGKHLNLEIRETPFDFMTGELTNPTERSNWVGNDNTEAMNSGTSGKARTELKLEKPDIPTRSRAQSLPDSSDNQYINFGPTDLVKDAGQTTVPYLDIQEVVTIPPTPLSGAGIYHKGHTDSGGYVALSISTYDFVKHLEVDLPPDTSGLNEIPSH